MVSSFSGLIRNQNRRSVVTTINDGVDKILLHCEFISSFNSKDISENGFELFEDIIFLTEKEIGNLSKGFSWRTAANGKIIFGLLQTDFLKETFNWVQYFHRFRR